MTSISVDLDEIKNVFVLSGDIDQLLQSRRAKIYLKDFLSADFLDARVEIAYLPEDRDLIIRKIQDFLKKFEAVQLNSEKVSAILRDFFQEEDNFKRFSEQAFQIRNNDLNEVHTKDFSDFIDVVTRRLPARILYPLQLLASYHLAFSQNACNFSVPGSGKTSIVYGAFAYLNSLKKDDPKYVEKLVVIGPLSSFAPWEKEYAECFGKVPSSKRLSGGVSKNERYAHFYASDPAEITLLSYNGIPNNTEDLIFFLKKYKVMVVLDEAHRVKNASGGIMATSVLALAKYCRSRVVLTGTPAPNGYEDIYNLFKFIWPTKNVIPFHLFQLAEMSQVYGDPRVKPLINSVSPYFIRVRKSDLNIPDPIDHDPTLVPMGDVQKEIYQYIEKNYMEYFGAAQGSESLKTKLAQARLIRLMQVSTNPALLKKPIMGYFDDEVVTETFVDDSAILNKIFNYAINETPPKFIRTKSLIEGILAKGEKVVVWATFVQNLEDLKFYLMSNGIPSELLYGGTPVEKDDLDPSIKTREKIIDEFHRPSSPFKVLIANPFAVSESISLHKVCHNAIYLERSFNAAHFIQSKDRIHRYGLKDSDETHYYYILSDNNTDHTIHQRLKEKEMRMMKVIESEPIPLFSRLEAEDEDDIKALINNYVSRTRKA